MKLIDMALEAYARHERESEIRHTEGVKQRVQDLEGLVERTFGIPFSEAFDVSKVIVQNEGYILQIDTHIYLHWDEDGLEVAVCEPEDQLFIGRVSFRVIGPDWYEANIISLGALLAKAHLQAENRKAAA